MAATMRKPRGTAESRSWYAWQARLLRQAEGKRAARFAAAAQEAVEAADEAPATLDRATLTAVQEACERACHAAGLGSLWVDDMVGWATDDLSRLTTRTGAQPSAGAVARAAQRARQRATRDRAEARAAADRVGEALGWHSHTDKVDRSAPRLVAEVTADMRPAERHAVAERYTHGALTRGEQVDAVLAAVTGAAVAPGRDKVLAWQISAALVLLAGHVPSVREPGAERYPGGWWAEPYYYPVPGRQGSVARETHDTAMSASAEAAWWRDQAREEARRSVRDAVRRARAWSLHDAGITHDGALRMVGWRTMAGVLHDHCVTGRRFSWERASALLLRSLAASTWEAWADGRSLPADPPAWWSPADATALRRAVRGR